MVTSGKIGTDEVENYDDDDDDDDDEGEGLDQEVEVEEDDDDDDFLELEEVIDDDGLGDNDEDFLASIQSSIRREFNARKSQRERERSLQEQAQEKEHSYVEEVVDEFEEVIKDEQEQDDEPEEEILEEEEYYEDQVIEKWFQVDTLPEDLETACRTLIPIVYKGEEYVDPDTMIRRTPLQELYKYLKQHYDYKRDVQQEICEETAHRVDSTVACHRQCSLQEIFQKRVQSAVVTVSNDDPSQFVINSRKGEEEEEAYETEEEILQSPLTSSEKQSIHHDDDDDDDVDGQSGNHVVTEESERDAIARWIQSDDLPDDIEVACKTLIPLVYDDGHVDPTKIMRRTPLPELFRYLQQNYKPTTALDGKDQDIIHDVSQCHNDSTKELAVLDEDRRGAKDDLGGSLQAFNESSLSYYEEEVVVVEHGMGSTRSFVEEEEEEVIEEVDDDDEEEVVEEEEMQVEDDFDEEVIYEVEEVVQSIRRGSL
jgi:hypothetical protein